MTSFATLYALFFMLFFLFSGLGYLLSVLIAPSKAYLGGVMIVVILYVLILDANPSPRANFVSHLSPMRWSRILYVCHEIQMYEPPHGVFNATHFLTLNGLVCSEENMTTSWVWLVLFACAFRGLAFVAIVFKGT